MIQHLGRHSFFVIICFFSLQAASAGVGRVQELMAAEQAKLSKLRAITGKLEALAQKFDEGSVAAATKMA